MRSLIRSKINNKGNLEDTEVEEVVRHGEITEEEAMAEVGVVEVEGEDVVAEVVELELWAIGSMYEHGLILPVSTPASWRHSLIGAVSKGTGLPA